MKIRRVHYRMLICCSVARSCLTLCDPIDCSTTGFLVLHHFLEFVQTYVHWFGDTIQPYLSSVVPFFFQSFPASGSFLVSQFFTSGGQLLELQLQKQSFQRIFRVSFLKDWLVWSLCSPRVSQESSTTPQFQSINSVVLSFFYGPTLTSIHDYW